MAKVGDKTTEENIRALMDDETWISAKEAFEIGLCDIVEEANNMAACINETQLKNFKNAPDILAQQLEPQQAISDEERQRIIAESQANLAYLKAQNLY